MRGELCSEWKSQLVLHAGQEGEVSSTITALGDSRKVERVPQHHQTWTPAEADVFFCSIIKPGL